MSLKGAFMNSNSILLLTFLREIIWPHLAADS